MTIESVIYDRLVAHAGTAALIGTRAHGGAVLPQGVTYPAAGFSRVTTERLPLMGADANVVRARFQVDCWAETYLSARALAAQVTAALNRWENAASSPVVHHVFGIADNDLYDADAAVHRAMLEFDVFFEG